MNPNRDVGIPPYEFDVGNVVIEHAVLEDAEGICEVMKQSWLTIYANATTGLSEKDILDNFEDDTGELSPELLAKWRQTIEQMDQEENHVLVARWGERIIAYLGAFVHEGHQTVAQMHVLPEFQRKRVGRALMNESLNLGRRRYGEDVYLHVAKYNQNAIRFYETFSFKQTDRDEWDDPIELRGGAVLRVPQIEMVRLAPF